jgi:hypothetical protein
LRNPFFPLRNFLKVLAVFSLSFRRQISDNRIDRDSFFFKKIVTTQIAKKGGDDASYPLWDLPF